MDASVVAGLKLFARYSYPPNERGYCGPDDHRTLLEYRAAGVADPGLAELARAFHGPWPYLVLLSERTGAGEPFSAPIVEAYWIGNELLDRVDTSDFGNYMEAQFRTRAGSKWPGMAEAIPGGVPHHSFHVFVTYPWVGLLDSGRGEPLFILDRCRIRWGRIVAVHGDLAEVMSRPLLYSKGRLFLGAPRLETATISVGGLGLDEPIHPGDVVALHWDWVCDRLSWRQLRHLRRFSAQQLELANHVLRQPRAATFF